jgi:hypothetical protein
LFGCGGEFAKDFLADWFEKVGDGGKLNKIRFDDRSLLKGAGGFGF